MANNRLISNTQFPDEFFAPFRDAGIIRLVKIAHWNVDIQIESDKLSELIFIHTYTTHTHISSRSHITIMPKEWNSHNLHQTRIKISKQLYTYFQMQCKCKYTVWRTKVSKNFFSALNEYNVQIHISFVN